MAKGWIKGPTRTFADFLQGCKDAIEFVPSLRVLNDRVENQILMTKLPEWAAARWNREVNSTLESTSEYPSFAAFVNFVVKEAKIACNPVSSLFALNDNERKVHKDTKQSNNKIRTLTTLSSAKPKNDSRNNVIICNYCKKDGHFIFKCDEFLTKTIEQKHTFIRENNLCYGCLRKGHQNKECKRKHTCATCGGKHPTCLYENRTPQKESTDNSADVKSASSFRVSRDLAQRTSMIVPVWVSHKDDHEKEILTYALLDTQSDTTFILDETASALGIPMKSVKLSLSTMTSQRTAIDSYRITDLRVTAFQSQKSDRISINSAYTRDFIPAERLHIPVKSTVNNQQHLQAIANELPPLQSCEVGLLIGYNCPQALALRKLLMGSDNQPYAVKTVLGWSVVGYSKVQIDNSSVTGIVHRTAVKELPACSPKDLLSIFDTDFADDIGKCKKVSQDYINFLSFMEKHIRQREDKHLEMPLPFQERPFLPNNKSLVIIRLNHLKRKLKNDQKYYEHYKQFMSEIISRGDAEIVETDTPEERPDLTNGLTGVLCRFRRHHIALMCDIEKMFHQFYVSEHDRYYLRFLWWEKGDMETNPVEYRMCKHLFGAASFPVCANYALKYLARTQEKNFPQASYFVQHNFYVDDGLTSVETEESAIELVRDSQRLCENGGIRLHKFVSNNVNITNKIPESASDLKQLNLALEALPVERALWVNWSIESDMFDFSIKVTATDPTRRNMLSVVASIFDPLGFLSPFTLTGKRILQEMCRNGVGWDDPLPTCNVPEWNNWIKDIKNLESFKVPRCIKPTDFGTSTSTELHHFSDASNNGYGQCTYVRMLNANKVHCCLLTVKARVAPQKVITIPRLELTAAVLSIKMSKFLKEELHMFIDKEYFWTDSQVVLGYINNDARRFHVFVANRVQMIREWTNPKQWFYVQSEDTQQIMHLEDSMPMT